MPHLHERNLHPLLRPLKGTIGESLPQSKRPALYLSLQTRFLSRMCACRTAQSSHRRAPEYCQPPKYTAVDCGAALTCKRLHALAMPCVDMGVHRTRYCHKGNRTARVEAIKKKAAFLSAIRWFQQHLGSARSLAFDITEADRLTSREVCMSSRAAWTALF